MTITERSIGDVTVLDVAGRLTIQGGISVFHDTIARLLDSGRAKILVNLAAVGYVDSTVLGEIMRAYTSAMRRGGAVKLLCPPPPVHQLLTMTRLDAVLAVFANEADAVKSFDVQAL